MELNLNLLPLFFKYAAISTGVLFYWRGTWILLDSYLFPGQPHWSAWASLLIGMVGMIAHNLYLIWQGESAIPMAIQEVDLDNKSITTTTAFPDDDIRCGAITSVVADGVCSDNVSVVKKYFVNTLKTYYFGFLVVNAWRGLWYCQDLYIVFPAMPMLSPWVSHICGIIILLSCAHFQSVFAPPYCHLPDEHIAKLTFR